MTLISQQPSSSSSSSSLSDLKTPQETTSAGILCRPSSSSSTSNLSIKFAPLPELAPRKRRSHAPLGVANRANMMRRQGVRRQASWDDQQTPCTNSHTHVNGDGTTVVVDYQNTKSPGTEEEEDPFLVLGRMVKGATKSLWRKVSNSNDNMDPKKKTITNPPHVVATIPRDQQQPDGDGVWEEEIDERFRKISADTTRDIGETETTVDGRSKYSWASPHRPTDPIGRLPEPPEHTPYRYSIAPPSGSLDMDEHFEHDPKGDTSENTPPASETET